MNPSLMCVPLNDTFQCVSHSTICVSHSTSHSTTINGQPQAHRHYAAREREALREVLAVH